MRNVACSLFLTVLIPFLVSCPNPGGSGIDPLQARSSDGVDTRGSGTLVITLPLIPLQPVYSKTSPDLTAVSSYDISGLGPGTASFQKLGITLSTITIDSLEPGDWSVTVIANNSKGLQIASQSVQVAVAAGEKASTDVAISPSVGSGTLDVYLEWPAGNVVSTPAVALTPQGGTPQGVILPAFVTLGALSSIHTYASFKAGSYTLSVSCLDGNGFTWGGAEAVCISPEGTTRLVFKPFDALKMTITPDVSAIFPIVLTSLKPNIGQGEDVSVTAALSQMISDKYTSHQWYLNGLLQPEGSATITFPRKSLPGGDYRLDVVIATQSALASSDVLFTIAGN